jgi:hypothetical protein
MSILGCVLREADFASVQERDVSVFVRLVTTVSVVN